MQHPRSSILTRASEFSACFAYASGWESSPAGAGGGGGLNLRILELIHPSWSHGSSTDLEFTQNHVTPRSSILTNVELTQWLTLEFPNKRQSGLPRMFH